MKAWKGLNYFSEPIGNCQLTFDFYIGYFYSSLREMQYVSVPGKIVFLLGNFKCNKYYKTTISYHFCEGIKVFHFSCTVHSFYIIFQTTKLENRIIYGKWIETEKDHL